MNGSIPDLTGRAYPIGGKSPAQMGFVTYGSDSGHQSSGAPRLDAERRSDPESWLHADEEDARRRDGADRADVRRASALQLLHRHVAGRSRSADRRPALSGRLRRRRRERADRQFFVADARPGADSHPGEASGELGHAREDQRDSRRVHAAVRRARRGGRRRHQQLHGLPRDLRRLAGRTEPASVGGEALPEQRRSEPRGHVRERVPDRRADLDARVRVSPLHVLVAAREWRRVVRHVAAEHRSVRQRAHRDGEVPRPGRGGCGRADAHASRRTRRHGLPDAGPRRESDGLRRRRPARTHAARSCRRCSIRPIPICRRSPRAAGR